MTLLARGRIKVDANKARDKLRDHMLVDLDLYATEIARAAVALGATTLDVRWDVDDVVLSMGPVRLTPTPDELESIRDRIVGTESDERGAALRLLGIGVNAALGLDPAFVDAAVGNVEIRFQRDAAPTRRALGADALAADRLRVRIRRRVGLELLERALRREPPRPVRYLLDRADQAPLRITVNGVLQTPPERVLERIELGGPGPLRAWLELHSAGSRACTTVFLERGIEMVRYDFVGRSEQPLTGDAPLRVVVDAQRLPANASRSAVRLEDPALRVLFAQVAGALDRLLLSLRTSEAGPRRDALGALVSWLAVRRRAGETSSTIQRETLQLPLLVSAYGDAISIDDLQGGSKGAPLLVHRQDQPLPRELEALVGFAVWPRGTPAERCLELLVRVDASERVAQAQLGLQRRARALARPQRAVEVPNASSYLVREAFHVDVGPFAGLHGQIALHRSNGQVDSSSVQAWVDGHPLEIVTVPGTSLPFALALAWDGRIRANLDYSAVLRATELTAAIAYAWSLAAIAACTRVDDPALARLAFVSWRAATRALGDPEELELPAALADAAIWPCADGTLVNVRHVTEYLSKTQALCIAHWEGGPAPDRRPVLSMPACQPLVDHFAQATLVDYGADLLGAAHTPPEPDALRSLPFGAPPLLGTVSIGAARMYVYHAGRLIVEAPHVSYYGDVDFTFDDRAGVPAKDGRRFVWSSRRPALAAHEDALLAAMLERVELQPSGSGRIAAAVSSYLEQSAQRIRQRLASSTLLRRLDTSATLARLDALAARFAQEEQRDAKAVFLARPAILAPIAAGAAQGHFDDPPRGTAAVLLPTGTAAAVLVVTFEGRTLSRRPYRHLPIAVHLEVHDEALVDPSWQGLDEVGRKWGRSAILHATLDLLRRGVRDPAFADDPAALQLVLELMSKPFVKGDWLTALVELLGDIQWPTIQGRRIRLTDTEPNVQTCAEVYPTYVHPYGSQDPDAVHLPNSALGTLRRGVLLVLGYLPIDVTAKVATTQTLRTRFGPDEPRFVDTFGRSHGLAALLERGDVLFTAAADHAGLSLEDNDTPILRLGTREIADVRLLLKAHGERTLVDASSWLDQERAARSKLAVDALVATRLSEEQRAVCRRFEAVRWKHLRMRGEIGLLTDTAAQQGRIVVHGAGRPLCELQTPFGLEVPFLAVVDLERVRANRAFDGFEFHADATRVINAVLASVRLMATATDLVEPPPPSLAQLVSANMTTPVPSAEPAKVAAEIPFEILVEAPEPAKEAFFVGLWRKALAVLVPPPEPADPSIVQAIAARITAMQLIDAGLTAVLDAGTPPDRTTRPLEFDARTGQLRVNLHDASVRALAATELGCEQLALAALSEINRERGAVTDAHERAVLVQALRRWVDEA